MPDYVESLKAHQVALANVRAWWPSTKQISPVAHYPEYPQLYTMSQGDLVQEMYAAMDETLPNNNDAFATSNRIKTSESHPIK